MISSRCSSDRFLSSPRKRGPSAFLKRLKSRWVPAFAGTTRCCCYGASSAPAIRPMNGR
jgi:hypothetical protein